MFICLPPGFPRCRRLCFFSRTQTKIFNSNCCSSNFSHSARLFRQQSRASFMLALCLRAVLISSPDMWVWTSMHALAVMHRQTLCENVDSAKLKVPIYTTDIDILRVASKHRIHIDESLHPYNLSVCLSSIVYCLSSVCLSVYLSIGLSTVPVLSIYISFSIYQSVSLYIFYVYFSTFLYVYLSSVFSINISPSVYLSLCLLYIFLIVCLTPCILSISLSVSPSMYLSCLLKRSHVMCYERGD